MVCVPKLRFHEFSGEWENKIVEDLIQEDVIEKPLDGNHGNLHPTSSDFVPEGIPFIMACDLKNGKADINNCQFIKKEQADNLQKGFSKEGDVLFSHKATIGHTAIVKDIKTEYIMLTPQVTYYRIKNYNKLNNYFLKCYFDSPKFQKLFNLWAIGSTRSYLGISKQQKLPIKFPDLNEQQKIASFLSKVDEKIEKLEKKQELWETYKKGIMQQIFSQKLRFKDENGEDYPDWEEKKLGTFSEKIREKNKDNLVENVFSNSAVNGLILQNDFFDKEIANKNNLSSYYVVENNFFVYNPRISKYAPVGPININKTGITGLVSPLYTVFAIKDKRISIIYLEYYFSNKLWHSYMRSVANYGARYDRMNITDKDFFDMPINLPSLTEQLKIANFLSAIETKFKLVQKELNENKEFKKGLLQQMFC